MALRFLDSFDHYTTLTQKWNVAPGSNSIAAAALRTGIAGMRNVNQNDAGPQITLDAQGTWIVGYAYRTNNFTTKLLATTTVDAGTVQGCFTINTDGTLTLRRGVTDVASSALSLLANVYYYIEFKHIIGNVAGTLEVRVDGSVWATFAGDSQQTANATASVIMMSQNSGAGGVANRDFDDIYILDGTGLAPNNDYWGSTQIECIVPTGVGNYTNWATLVGAPTHWQAEDEVPPDEDTSYIESAVLNQQDTYAMGNITPASATINGIQVLMRARTTLAGAANIARLYRNAGVDDQGADIVLQTSYNYAREVLGLDPITAAAWTVARINSMEMGAVVR